MSDRIKSAAICVCIPLLLVVMGCGDKAGNHSPVADAISFAVAPDIPYIEQRLSGSDPDGDVISYELLSSSSGSGYGEAVIVSTTGILYMILEPDYLGSIVLEYTVTDGHLYSETAKVTIDVVASLGDERGIGAEGIDPAVYGGFSEGAYGSVLLADSSGATSLPSSIDLSGNFPVPGDQGGMGSCVGWSTAYALKTYQERVEVGWAINTRSHIFSPAYVFNQIALPGCGGSRIDEALDLLVQQGCATLATVAYTDSGCSTQPSAQARAEASNFRASRWVRLSSSTDAKKALMNRQPVVIGMDVYSDFQQLSGSNAVYNTTTGDVRGGHAVTLTGYDDAKFGGAFRVINSWGTSWGDNGYFWLPYAQISKVVSQMYTLEDSDNESDPVDPDDPVVPSPDGYPNLTISSWDADIGTQPGGGGTLRYKIVNTGQTVATGGFNVCFMLSKDRSFTRDDVYLLWETVTFSLNPGGAAFRDASNPIWYPLPEDCEYGAYYPALWVDDLNIVEESNELDNVAIGSNQLVISAPKPDLQLNSLSWSYTVLGRGCTKTLPAPSTYRSKDDIGYAKIKYEIENASNVVLDDSWHLNVVLASSMSRNASQMHVLYTETFSAPIEPWETVTRTDENPAEFNLMETWNGRAVEPGIYYMGVLVDAYDEVDEAVELYNDRWIEDHPFRISDIGVTLVCTKQDEASSGEGEEKGAPHEQIDQAFAFEASPKGMRSVEVFEKSDGTFELDYYDGGEARLPEELQKTLHSEDYVAFPIVEQHAMP